MNELTPAERMALREHLADCEHCHRFRPQRRWRPRLDRSSILAAVATCVFGMLGLSLVLMVSFRESPPLSPALSPALSPPAAATTPAPTTLTIVESSIDASGE